MFRGTVVEQIALPALDHVIVLSCVGTAIYMRVYSLHFKRSGTKVARRCGELCNLHAFLDSEGIIHVDSVG
jgi:hypothetical protein